MKANFNGEQLEWLRSRLPDYVARVNKTVPRETGRQFALQSGKDFLQKWETLENHPNATRDDIVEKIHEWFKNNNKTPRPVALLKPRVEPSKSAAQLFADHDPKFKAEFARRRTGEPRERNLEIYAKLRDEMWLALPHTEKEEWTKKAEEARAHKHAEPTGSQKEINRKMLEGSIQATLASYAEQTDFSFCLLATGPASESDQVPHVFTYEYSPVPGVPFFQDFHKSYETSISIPWGEYGLLINNRRITNHQVQKLINFDNEGYPILPPKTLTWSVSEGAAILRVYLEQLWLKLQPTLSPHQFLPWDSLQANPSAFIDMEKVPMTLQKIRRPTDLEPDQIIDLHRFCTTLIGRPPSERFPFILSDVHAFKSLIDGPTSSSGPSLDIEPQLADSLTPLRSPTTEIGTQLWANEECVSTIAPNVEVVATLGPPPIADERDDHSPCSRASRNKRPVSSVESHISPPNSSIGNQSLSDPRDTSSNKRRRVLNPPIMVPSQPSPRQTRSRRAPTRLPCTVANPDERTDTSHSSTKARGSSQRATSPGNIMNAVASSLASKAVEEPSGQRRKRGRPRKVPEPVIYASANENLGDHAVSGATANPLLARVRRSSRHK